MNILLRNMKIAFGFRLGLAGLVFAGCIFAGCLSGADSSAVTAGRETITLEGSAQGFRGTVRVFMRLSGNEINDIEIAPNNEDRYAQEAMIELRNYILETGTVDVDVVSGATVSCRAFLDALKAAAAAGPNRNAD